ncbi:hypothetical protein ACFTQL_05940 [Peribacillus butanolivorans]
MNGKSILILGAGAIGGEVARLEKAFRMTTRSNVAEILLIVFMGSLS